MFTPHLSLSEDKNLDPFVSKNFGKVDISEFICGEIKLESLTLQACLSLGLFCAYPE